jgi:hypothetical protein
VLSRKADVVDFVSWSGEGRVAGSAVYLQGVSGVEGLVAVETIAKNPGS